MKLKSENQNDFILSNYSFDSLGNSISVDLKNAAAKLNNKKLNWIHLDGSDKDSKVWVEENAKFLDNLIIDELFANETRPRIIEFNDGMLIILRSVNSLESKSKNYEDMSSIRIWLDENRIISVQKRNFMPVVNLMNSIEVGAKIKNSGDFLYVLLNEIMLLCGKAIINFDENLDKIEKRIEKNKLDNKLIDFLSTLRKQAAVFKRYMIPQKDVLSFLQTTEYQWIEPLAIRHFQENFNRTCHLIEEIDEIKERSKIIHEEIRDNFAQKNNVSTFKLSLIASVFLPLGVVASLFGMNVGGIPFFEHQSGFYIISYFMAVIFGALYLILRNKNNI